MNGRCIGNSLKVGGALALLALTSACSGAVHDLPTVTDTELRLAKAELHEGGNAPARHQVADEEVMAIGRSVLARIRPAAERMCREMAVGVCEWNIHPSGSRVFNASARPGGEIVINRGIFEFADNEEEVALVIAHEMSHHAANHVVASQRNRMAGAIIGGVLLGVAGAALSYKSYDAGSITGAATRAGANMGAAVGGIAFSKEQEREADYLAAVILFRSGMDLEKARGAFLKMARMTGKQNTGLLDSHPAGPERIAAWDRAVQEVKASNGALPPRSGSR